MTDLTDTPAERDDTPTGLITPSGAPLSSTPPQHPEGSVAALVHRLQGMLGYLRRRDRETVANAIACITQITVRLQQAMAVAVELHRELAALKPKEAQTQREGDLVITRPDLDPTA